MPGVVTSEHAALELIRSACLGSSYLCAMVRHKRRRRNSGTAAGEREEASEIMIAVVVFPGSA